MLICTNQTTDPDPLNWIVVDVPLPPGYGRVFSGTVRPGDLHYNRRFVEGKGADGSGQSRWLPAYPVRDGLDPLYLRCSAYSAIIRPGVPSEPACERCGHEDRFEGERFCLDCGYLICREGRRRHGRR